MQCINSTFNVFAKCYTLSVTEQLISFRVMIKSQAVNKALPKSIKHYIFSFSSKKKRKEKKNIADISYSIYSHFSVTQHFILPIN